MRTRPPNLFPLFASAHQGQLLSVLFDQAEQWKTFDDLRKECGVSASTLHTELMRLLSACIIERDDSSRPYRFRINMKSPVAQPLATIVEQTVGAERLIGHALKAVDGVTAAAIFGSWARGEAGPESDIDVIVVGKPARGALAAAIHPVELRLDRDVNLVVYSQHEVRERLESSFFRAIAEDQLIELFGDLKAMLSKAVVNPQRSAA